jgi:dolichyl-phosphate beta-glucosyltransferase
MSEAATPELSIVIPAFNEEQRLPLFLAGALQWLAASDMGREVIVVDDGSNDATASVAEKHGVRVIRHDRNRGKGAAVRTGMLAARGRLRLFVDADGATTMDEFPALLAAIRDGAQVAVGSREGGGKVVKVSGLRKFLGRWFNRAVRVGAVSGIKDTQCGFKLFTDAAAETLFSLSREDGYAFDVEVLFLAQKLGMKIAEVPVNWTEIPGSKVRVWRDGVRMLRAVQRIKRRWRGREYTNPAETA